MKLAEKRLIKIIIQTVAILMLVVVALYFAKLASDSEMIKSTIQQFGYLGLFIISTISGFNVIVPIPAIALLPLFVESGLNPYLTVGIIALGMTLGDFLGFLIGDTGRKIVHHTSSKKVLHRLEKLRDKNPKIPLILLFAWASAAPLPNEIIVIPLAFMGYKVSRVMLIVLLGNALFNSLIAYGILSVYQTF